MLGLGNLGLGLQSEPSLQAQVRALLRNLYSGTEFLPSTTMCFQESTGVTPSVQDGVVGCIVDSATPVGAELVTNGDFSNGLTGWINSSTGLGTATVIDGQLHLYRIDSTNAGKVLQSIGTAGKSYRVEFTVVTGTVFVSLAGAGGNYTAGQKSVLMVQTGSGLYIESVSNGTTAVIDNISVREVGLIATQAIAGNKPLLKKEGNIWYVKMDNIDDKIAIASALLTGHTAATLIYSIKGVGHLTLQNQNISAGLTITQDKWCDLLICKTAPSAAHLALMERYADWLAGGTQTLSANLVTNGDFSDGSTGWNPVGSVTIAAGVATFANTGDIQYTTGVFVSGRTYLVQFDRETTTAGILSIYANVAAQAIYNATTSGTGTHRFIVTATTTGNIRFKSFGYAGTIDNISVKEVTFS